MDLMVYFFQFILLYFHVFVNLQQMINVQNQIVKNQKVNYHQKDQIFVNLIFNDVFFQFYYFFVKNLMIYLIINSFYLDIIIVQEMIQNLLLMIFDFMIFYFVVNELIMLLHFQIQKILILNYFM